MKNQSEILNPCEHCGAENIDKTLYPSECEQAFSSVRWDHFHGFVLDVSEVDVFPKNTHPDDPNAEVIGFSFVVCPGCGMIREEGTDDWYDSNGDGRYCCQECWIHHIYNEDNPVPKGFYGCD